MTHSAAFLKRQKIIKIIITTCIKKTLVTMKALPSWQELCGYSAGPLCVRFQWPYSMHHAELWGCSPVLLELPSPGWCPAVKSRWSLVDGLKCSAERWSKAGPDSIHLGRDRLGPGHLLFFWGHFASRWKMAQKFGGKSPKLLLLDSKLPLLGSSNPDK